MLVRFLNAVLLTIAISPAFVLGFTLLCQTGAVAQEYASRLTNLVLAHYLNDRSPFSLQNLSIYLDCAALWLRLSLILRPQARFLWPPLPQAVFCWVWCVFCAASTGLTALSGTVFFDAKLGICNYFCGTRSMGHSQRAACSSVVSCCAL